MIAGLEQPTHLLFLLLIVLLLFGAKRLPELGRSLGRGIKEFREGVNSKEEMPVEKERTEAIGKQETGARRSGQEERHPQKDVKDEDSKQQWSTYPEDASQEKEASRPEREPVVPE